MGTPDTRLETADMAVLLLLALGIVQVISGLRGDMGLNAVPNMGKRGEAPVSWQLGKRSPLEVMSLGSLSTQELLKEIEKRRNAPRPNTKFSISLPWSQLKRSGEVPGTRILDLARFRYNGFPSLFPNQLVYKRSPEDDDISRYEDRLYKRAEDMTSSLNGVPMLGKREEDFPASEGSLDDRTSSVEM